MRKSTFNFPDFFNGPELMTSAKNIFCQILTNYCHALIQENDMQFTIEELLEMARGIASGMKCLSEMGFVHRVSHYQPHSLNI